MRLRPIRLQRLKPPLDKDMEYHLCEAATQGYPVIKPRLSLPAKPSPFATESMIPAVRLPLKQSQIPTRPLPALPSTKRHHRRTLSKAVEQLVYAVMALALSAVVYHYFRNHDLILNLFSAGQACRLLGQSSSGSITVITGSALSPGPHMA